MKVLLLLSCLLFFPKENSQLKIPRNFFTEEENSETRVEEWRSLEKSDEEAENEGAPTMEEMRLPKTLVPDKYWLTVHLFFPAKNYSYPEDKDFTFDGHVKILISCLNDTDLIVLNGVDLEIDEGSFRLESQEGDTIGLKGKVSINKKMQLIQFPLEQSLKRGQKYTLELNYRGIISEQLFGLYRSYYILDGKKVWLAVTDFEPADARRAFPGFDEPDMKATFCLRIRHPPSLRAISNTMEWRSFHIRHNLMETQFRETPRMSTYLLALVVFDFEMIQTMSENGVLIRVWVPSIHLKSAQFAAEIAWRLMDYFQNYFQTPYPMLKQDFVSVPQFGSGAMENWGLITFKEEHILYDSQLNTIKRKQQVAETVAHELTHQWFGNLVTMKWWDNLWLNEGFATLFESKAAKAVLGESYDEASEFLTGCIQKGMGADEINSTHPLFIGDISSYQQISFDTITYQKGASILAMVRNVIGEDAFHKGLIAYLNKFEYENVDHIDLWSRISEVSPLEGNNMNFKEFALDWTVQPGYPLVSVARDYADGTAKITQKRFAVGFTPTGDQRWRVPIWYTTNRNPQVKLTWLQPDEDGILEGLKDVDWLLVNPHVQGFYRVNYDAENWQRLIEQLKCNHLAIPTTSRAQLVADAFKLVEQQLLPREVSLKLSEVLLSKETEFGPLNAVIRQLLGLALPYRDTAAFFYAQKFFILVLKPLYWKYGWNKPQIVAYLCGLGDNFCLTDARNAFDELKIACKCQLLSSPCNKLSLLKRYIIYRLAVKFGSIYDWEYLWEKLQQETEAEERSAIIAGLASTKELWRIDWLLNASIELNGFKLHETGHLLFFFQGSAIHRFAIFDFLKRNWPTKAKMETGQNKLILQMIAQLKESAKRNAQLRKELEEFLRRNDPEHGNWLDEEQLEESRNFAEEATKDKWTIIRWFQDYVERKQQLM